MPATEPRLRRAPGRSGIVPPGIAPGSRRPCTSWAAWRASLWCERAGAPRSWLADEERFAEALAGFVALIIATSERRRTENELRRASRTWIGRPRRRGPRGGGRGRLPPRARRRPPTRSTKTWISTDDGRRDRTGRASARQATRCVTSSESSDLSRPCFRCLPDQRRSRYAADAGAARAALPRGASEDCPDRTIHEEAVTAS